MALRIQKLEADLVDVRRAAHLQLGLTFPCQCVPPDPVEYRALNGSYPWQRAGNMGSLPMTWVQEGGKWLLRTHVPGAKDMSHKWIALKTSPLFAPVSGSVFYK